MEDIETGNLLLDIVIWLARMAIVVWLTLRLVRSILHEEIVKALNEWENQPPTPKV